MYNNQLALRGEVVKMIHSIGSPDQNKSFYLEKKPLKSIDNHIIGIIFYCHELINPKITQNVLNLTQRELECLFCIFRGMTAKNIAEKFNLSKRTIEFYIDNIKNKFGCSTKSELIMMAIKHGYTI